MDSVVLLTVLILFIVACEAVAQSCANQFAHNSIFWYLLAGGLFYLIVVFLLAEAHKLAPMGVVNAIWSGLSVVCISSVGYIFFDQKITYDQMAMMGVIGIGVAYLAVNQEPSPG